MIVTAAARPLKGTVVAPPSKSMTHRALILSNFAGGRVENPLQCDDTEAMRRCLYGLNTGGVMDAGGSATALRLLIPVAVAQNGGGEFLVDETLKNRPLDEYSRLGFTLSRDGRRISVRGRLKRAYSVDASVSSQFASGLMLALALSGGGAITVYGAASRPYIDMTVAMLRLYGVAVLKNGDVYEIPGEGLAPADVTVEGDWSYAANFYAANALGGSVVVSGLDPDSVQGDRAIAELIGRDEADVTDVPDILMPLMAAACGRRGDTRFIGTGRLKYKESDRPEGMRALIEALGGSVTLGEDSATVHGTGRLRGGTVEVRDHRIAMAAAVLAPICDSPVTILGAECVNKSAPQFYRDIERLGGITV